MTAADRWRRGLEQWAIPEHILSAAPANPHAFSVRRFSELADEAVRQPPTITHRRAAARLPDGGSVLDVGCGGGAGSLPLADRAGLLVGADQSAEMLRAYRAAAGRAGVPVRTVQGGWPDAAGDAPVADVVVCLHVIYNVAALVPFAGALTSHARHRVVLEFPTRHPLDWLGPYWKAVHDLDRPKVPTADDALEAFTDLGYAPRQERWERSNSLHGASLDDRVAFVSQRLAVGDDRRAEVAALVTDLGVPTTRTVVTAWWDVDVSEEPRPEQAVA
jgi:SAM-dependent methyltransferase